MELDSEGLDSPVKVIACKETEQLETNDVYEVEKITGMRLVKGKLWFRVRWKGYGADMATWEPRANLTHCEELLDDYVSKVQDKKYKQKKRRQTRNALIHSRKKELKDDGLNHVVKNKVAFNGPIRRKRFIRKFISKPNRFFNQMPQTKWPMDESELEMVSPEKPEKLPLEIRKEKEPRRQTGRRRGRPRKNPTHKMPDLQPQTQLYPETSDREPLETVNDIIMLENNSAPEQKLETVVKRGRGRPPKKKITEHRKKLQNDLCRQERPKDIVKKRGRPKKGVVSGGVTKATTHHPYKGQIKLKKVVIRELRSLKALLEFQRQISDEEKENQTDSYHKEENPSSMENRHVLASEYHNRFYIRIKTGGFKDLSTKRRRKRKAHKEKRRKKKEALQREEQTDIDKEKSECLDKQTCYEIEEDRKGGSDFPEVVKIVSSSEEENGDEDSVESQRDAPALNEEYDQFGYDDFFDFSKENSNERDKSEKEDSADGELPQVLEEREMDGGELSGDDIVAIESECLQPASPSRSEHLAEKDAITKEEEKVEEEATAADDESSSLVIPFDEEEEEEESSSLIIADDGMEDDDDDDDDDDLREFDIVSEEIQGPKPSTTMIFTTDSVHVGNMGKGFTGEKSRVDETEYGKLEHCQKRFEDVDSGEFVIAEKPFGEDTYSQQKEKDDMNMNGTLSIDSLRGEYVEEPFERESNYSSSHEDITYCDGEKDAIETFESRKVDFMEDSSNLVEKQMGQLDTDEIGKDDETESGDVNSGSSVPVETENALEESTNDRDKTVIEDEEPLRVGQTPIVETLMEEEVCAVEVMNSKIFPRTKNVNAKSHEGKEKEGGNVDRMEEECNEKGKEDREGQDDRTEPQVKLLLKGKRMEGEVKDEEEMDSELAEEQDTTEEEAVEKNDAAKMVNSEIRTKEMDDVENKAEAFVEHMEEGNREEVRETSDVLIEPQVKVLSKEMEIEAKDGVKDKETEPETMSPQKSFADGTVEENHAVETMNSEIYSIKIDEEIDSIDIQGKVACVQEMEGEFDMEEESKVEDNVTEPQAAKPSEAKELDKEVPAQYKQIESEAAVTEETTEKDVDFVEEMEHQKNDVDVPQRGSNNMRTDVTTAEESDKTDDQREQDEENLNKDYKELESVMPGAQENGEKEVRNHVDVEHENDAVRERDNETLNSDLAISDEEKNEENVDQEEACDENMAETEKEGEEQVACDEKMEEETNEEESRTVLLSKSREIEVEPQADEAMELEMAVAVGTIEKELRLDEEVEWERNNMPRTDDDQVHPDLTTAKEIDNVEYDDHGKQEKERMESEIAGAREIANKELKMVEEVESEMNTLPQTDIENLKPDFTVTKEAEIELDDYQEEDSKQMEDQKEEEAKRERTPEEISSVAEGAIESGEKEEMEVEETADGQIESETILPQRDETGHQEGDNVVATVTKAEGEKMFTCTEENVKDQGIKKEDGQDVDEECKDNIEEDAVTVAKEQRMEYGDNQKVDVQGIPDILLEDKESVVIEKEDCDNEKTLAEREEAKTISESKDGGKETNEGDEAVNGEEATVSKISTAEPNLHVAEEKVRNRENGEKNIKENISGVLENICNNHKEDRESINNANAQNGNNLSEEKRVEGEMTDSCHDNMDNGDNALLRVTGRDGGDKENREKTRDTVDEIKITNGITDEQKAERTDNKQIPFPDKVENAESRTTGNLEDVPEDGTQEKIEVVEDIISGNSGHIQESDLHEKMEVDNGDRKATDICSDDRVEMMEGEELEEGEIPEDEEEEEDKKEDGMKDNDKEEGEITEEMEDAIEERGRIDEEDRGKVDDDDEISPGSTDRSKDIGQNSENSHSQKVKPSRRSSREAIEIVETSSTNSEHQTTLHNAKKTIKTRSSAVNMKRNFNGAYSTKERKRSKTLEPSDTIAVDDDDDNDVEVVEHDVHPKKLSKRSNENNFQESDVYIVDEEPAKCTKPHDNGVDIVEQMEERTVKSKQNFGGLSPKFGGGLKKVSPTTGLHVSKVDKNGSNARRMVQSMKDHIQNNICRSRESGKNGQAVMKNSTCKAQGFKLKDSVGTDRRDNLFNRLEEVGSGDAERRVGKSGTKRKSDDEDDDGGNGDDDCGSKTQPKKKLAGVSGKEVWQMVPRKEKKPTEPVWEGSTKINRQKIVIKISKKLLTDQPETKEPENNTKKKDSEKSSSLNGWKEGRKAEGAGGDKGYHEGIKANGLEEEQKEKIQVNGRRGRTASTSTGVTGHWSEVPKAKPDNKTVNDAGRKSRRESGTNSRDPSDDLLKDLKELKTHGIKQTDLPWVKDLLETDHAECLSEACAALTKFMDSKDQKINLVVEMGFCPLLVKLLRSRSPEVISSALLAVSHIVSGNDYQTQAVLECSPLPLFCSFLSRHKHDVTLRKEACLALSNITAGTSQQIQHLVNDGLFPVLLSAMQHDEFQVMYEATWAVANATVNGSPEQIRYIVKQGFFQAFSEVLKNTDDTLIQIALDAMFNVLKLDTKQKKAGKPTPYCSQVKEFGGLERIRTVRLTGSTVVKKKAYNMLTTFFPDF